MQCPLCVLVCAFIISIIVTRDTSNLIQLCIMTRLHTLVFVGIMYFADIARRFATELEILIIFTFCGFRKTDLKNHDYIVFYGLRFTIIMFGFYLYPLFKTIFGQINRTFFSQSIAFLLLKSCLLLCAVTQRSKSKNKGMHKVLWHLVE